MKGFDGFRKFLSGCFGGGTGSPVGDSVTQSIPNGHRKHLIFAWIFCLGVVLITAWAYAPGFSTAFTFDDEPNIVDNPAIHWTSVSAENFDMLTSKAILPRRIVSNISFALNHVAGGLNPWGYHFVNLLIHLSVGATLIWLTGIYLRAVGPPAKPDSMAFALVISSAFFLLHPLNTQAVTYIVQRMAALAALFTLLAFSFYLKARHRIGRHRKWYFTAAVACWIVALGSKENAVLFVPLILLHEWCFFREAWDGRIKGWLGRRGVAWLPFLKVVAVIGAGLVLWKILLTLGFIRWSRRVSCGFIAP
jgi:hypothetical protein